MTISVKPIAGTKIDADVLAVCILKETNWRAGKEFLDLDRAIGGILTSVVDAEGFEPEHGKTLLLHTHGKIPARRILLVGLGDSKELTVYLWQTALATIGRAAQDVRASTLAISVPGDGLPFEPATAFQAAVEGIFLGTYTFKKHKKPVRTDSQIVQTVFLTSAPRLDAASRGVTRGEHIAKAVMFARDLVNEPPSVTTPTHLAHVAQSIAKGKKEFSCEVVGVSEIKKFGMGGLLGIARGSDEEPRFIKLVYKGGGRKTIVLVGKGITFDTGGLSLKPSSGMETMKLDMAGAAAVFGVFHALTMLTPKVNVVGLVAATENMPSGRAIKPGDIVRAMNGKTIEILNTDAEGRVILADALSYAVEKVKPDVIIDLATLTGACMVALGEEVTGLFSNNPELSSALKQSGEGTGERVWELPLVKEYQDSLKSTVADLKNITGGKYGGAITAALFLREFVPDSVPWAHLDIAGPAFAEKDTPLTPKGGTGFGVRMLLEYLRSF
ncbi:MAG: leucyl aminopeptidase [bacterium]|nr:leucyl aminopeptidase [bacterium]